MSIGVFIEKWKKTGASERANFQPFIMELVSLLGVDPIGGASASKKGDDYAFERPVKNRITGKTNFIDLYRRGCFVMEGKQGSDNPEKTRNPLQQELKLGKYLPADNRKGTARRGTKEWLKEMVKARQQAERYARNLEADQGLPPFIIVVDVGYVIELYADFGGQGKYEQYPNRNEYRIYMDDLLKEEVQELFCMIWTEPQSLDTSKYAAQVTREVAAELAELGKSYASKGFADETVAKFLMRCLFTMFAEDVELIPLLSFETLLKNARDKKAHKNVPKLLEELWSTMNEGGFSVAISEDLVRFNGGLFREDKGGTIAALPVNEVQLGLLINAAEKDWTNVEPSIFGTLLERALSPKDRHKLGAHYTPRPYVERLVVPTIMDPLRADFDAAKAAAMSRLDKGHAEEARKIIKDFHHTLCTIRILDPACGSGNFLYVAMDRMKRLEADVLSFLEDLGEDAPKLLLQGETIDPHQFLGIEINPWAVWAAELVLWIGFLQWHFKTFGKAAPTEPVLKDFHNIEKRDALLEWESTELRRDDDGKIVTRWDGESFIKSNVTGENIPDPEARAEVYNYHEPKIAKWPQADFIIGNPPFLGKLKMREELGDGYVEALRAAYKDIPDSADFVMYWWDKAAQASKAFNPKAKKTTKKGTRRFGLITTKSISQTFNRRVVEKYVHFKSKSLSIRYSIPNHPWVDSIDGAAVRIALNVCQLGSGSGMLNRVAWEEASENEVTGKIVKFDKVDGLIFPNLTVGVNVTNVVNLASNDKVATCGVIPHGTNMVVSASLAESLQNNESVQSNILKDYCNGQELKRGILVRKVIDAYPLSEKELLLKAPKIYQWLYDRVKPDRDINSDDYLRENWWLHRRTNTVLRDSLKGINRYIGTILTSKHRWFSFLSGSILPDQTIVAIAIDSSSILAVLSSNTHVKWALAAGGRLGVGNDPRYNKTVCFDPFPFPDFTDKLDLQSHLNDLGERLDKHRKRCQAEHPKLTLTQMYNVLEKVRAGETIEGKDKIIYDQGLIGILKQIHDDIDTATAEAYGWPNDLTDEEILQRLVDLNRERALEEAKGHIQWLRPEYQNPDGHEAKAKSGELDLEDASLPGAASWPKALPEQMAVVRQALLNAGQANVEDIRSQFKGARTKTITERLDTLTALGQAVLLEDGRYAA